MSIEQGYKTPLLGLNKTEIEDIVKSKGLEKYRASQIFSWLYKTPVMDIDLMTNIPIKEREFLKKDYCLTTITLEKTSDSKSSSSKKYLFKTRDNNFIESVKISNHYAAPTICISSQIGCAIKCKFCATGGIKFVRNLTAEEIISQLIYLIQLEREMIGNVVFMGMGEPLLNYKNVIKSIKLMNDPQGLKIGARRITISTCGIPKFIRNLSNEELGINLAVSLNATDDKTRSFLMPINRVYPIRELLSAVDYYTKKTNRRVSFEYVLIRGINDSIKDAKKLVEILNGRLCHVNLILLNKISNSKFYPTSIERAKLFVEILAHGGVNATIRKSKGTDISAACGQLAAKKF